MGMALTPMMRQYQEIKATLEDALLMFRLGDFYELFFDDAVVASRVLDITLTGRDAGEAGRIPMCGVPYHALEQYLERLVEKGYRVAICEQVEDPKTAKGLVSREVVRIVTPGTALSKENSQRFLAAFAVQGHVAAVVFIDVGTGEVLTGMESVRACIEQVYLHRPIEILVDKSADIPANLASYIDESGVLLTRRACRFESAIESQYGIASPVALGIPVDSPLHMAMEMALQYVATTQKMTLQHIKEPRGLFSGRHLVLNQTAMHHLELVATARDGARKGSLLDLLDQTVTAAGGRTLRAWLERPLCDLDGILERHETVRFFYEDMILREEVRQALRGIHDMARIVARFAFGSATARDLLALSKSLAHAFSAVDALRANSLPPLLSRALASLSDLSTLEADIAAQIVDEPPVSTRDGGMFRVGVHEELDRLRHLQTSGRTWLRDLEAAERERTGIRSLKIGYNKVFGYYIEVSKANLQHVPETYERRQTLASAERFVLPELKEREAEILSAEERAMAYEHELFQALASEVLARRVDIQAWSDVLAQIDVLTTLAHVAMEKRYVQPRMRETTGLSIQSGRHPVVEQLVAKSFVPNDTYLSPDDPIIVLTGPNMGGKSTFMRQTAVICIMAQMGGFVPAKHAEIGIVDQIFARIGAADDLGRGQSTFMVEMIELAEILRQATGRSLVLLDEIGRGTSTYDGLSIAEAVLEEFASREERPLTMFATHYHELIDFSHRFTSVRNHSMAVEESEDGITFLHTVVERPSDKSYGIQVARLAGLPSSVIARAQAILNSREGQATGSDPVAQSNAQVAATQETTATRSSGQAMKSEPLSLFAGPFQAFAESLANVDVLSMTPLEAMNRLHELSVEARRLSEWETSK